MKIGDFVRSRVNNYYGLILATGGEPRGPRDVRVLWQGLTCVTTWEFAENELTSFGGNQ